MDIRNSGGNVSCVCSASTMYYHFFNLKEIDLSLENEANEVQVQHCDFMKYRRDPHDRLYFTITYVCPPRSNQGSPATIAGSDHSEPTAQSKRQYLQLESHNSPPAE